MLEIRDLHVSVAGEEILKGVDVTVNGGEVHAVMGPNGSGKSTLANVIAGRPGYDVTRGQVLYERRSLLGVPPDQRAREGIFLAFQYPVELPGVRNRSSSSRPWTRSAGTGGRRSSAQESSTSCSRRRSSWSASTPTLSSGPLTKATRAARRSATRYSSSLFWTQGLLCWTRPIRDWISTPSRA